MNSLPVLPQEIQPQANPLVNVFNTVIDGVSQLAVNARDLHKFLKVGRDFSTWIKSRIEQYVFIKNVDYILVHQNGGIKIDTPQIGGMQKRGGDKRSIQYHLTLDMAKELSMVENNEEGRKVRRYFIRCEKDLYKSDSQQREILVKACSKLAIGNMLISDVYLMVGKQFGYDDGIKNIPTPLLPEATAFAYEMILRLKPQQEQPFDREYAKKMYSMGKAKADSTRETIDLLQKALTDLDYGLKEITKNNATHFGIFESLKVEVSAVR